MLRAFSRQECRGHYNNKRPIVLLDILFSMEFIVTNGLIRHRPRECAQRGTPCGQPPSPVWTNQIFAFNNTHTADMGSR